MGSPGGRAVSGERRDRALLARLGRRPGLCATCRYRRLQASARSVFVRCAAPAETHLPRYPTLPVLECRGYPEPEKRPG